MHRALGRAVLDVDLSYPEITELQQIPNPSQGRFKWARYCEIDEVSEDNKSGVHTLADIQLCHKDDLYSIIERVRKTL